MQDELKKVETYSPFAEDRRSTEEKVKGVGLRTSGAPDLETSGDAPMIKKDASGQFAKSQADANNDGMTSAEPRVLSPHGQAPTADQQEAHHRDPDDIQGRRGNDG